MKVTFGLFAVTLVSQVTAVKLSDPTEMLAQLDSAADSEGMPGAGTQNSPTINIIDNNRNMSTGGGGGCGCGGGYGGANGYGGFGNMMSQISCNNIMPGGTPFNPLNMMSLPMNMQSMMQGMQTNGCLPVRLPQKNYKPPPMPMLNNMMAR